MSAAASADAMNPRTRMLLEAPIASTLLRMAAPNVLVMLAQAGVGLIETYFVGKLGTDALAGMALVFPVVMLMQMMSAGAIGGGVAAAIARALGARRREDADALVLHALVIGLVFSLVFTLAVVGGGRWLYARMGGAGARWRRRSSIPTGCLPVRSASGCSTPWRPSSAARATWPCRPMSRYGAHWCSSPCRRC